MLNLGVFMYVPLLLPSPKSFYPVLGIRTALETAGRNFQGYADAPAFYLQQGEIAKLRVTIKQLKLGVLSQGSMLRAGTFPQLSGYDTLGREIALSIRFCYCMALRKVQALLGRPD